MLPRRSVLCLSLLPVKLKSHRLRCSVLLESSTLTESVYPLPWHVSVLFHSLLGRNALGRLAHENLMPSRFC